MGGPYCRAKKVICNPCKHYLVPFFMKGGQKKHLERTIYGPI